MKYIAVLALLGAVDAKHHHRHHDVGFIQSRVMGVPKEQLHPDRHWNLPWPQGIDDSTDDDKIMNWIRKPEEPAPPIRYHDKMRQWQPGTWPVNFSWNDDWNHASYHNEIDDGTDDNEVVDVMHRGENI